MGFELYFPREYLKPALAVSLLSVLVLVGVFFYLNRYTRRRYFSYWTVAWIFYALWLTWGIGLHELPDSPWSILVRQLCLGSSAVFLLWGSAWFLNQRMQIRHLVLFLAFLFLWSYLGAYEFKNAQQAQVPLFGLIGLVSQVTALCFYRLRREQKFLGSGLLAAGFSLWGLHLAASPFLHASPDLIGTSLYISAILQLFIAVSMIILVLEEVRLTNQAAFQRIRSYKSKTDLLQKKIASTEERYRSLFDQASEGIVVVEAGQLRIRELNQTARRLLGLSESEAGQASLSSFCRLHPEPPVRPGTGPEWFAAICRHRRLNLVRRDGGVTPVEADGAPISYEGNPAYQFFLRELTDRARLEEQLRQSEKLSALGQMISGVAHELNNPLAVIKGYLELILARHELNAATRADLEKVAKESNRAARLVNNFLSFARQQPVHREPIQLNAVIGRAAESRKTDLQRARIELRLNLATDLPCTDADSEQLQQTIANLLGNAIDAVSSVARPGVIQITSRRLENLIVVTVEDNGPGVSPEVLPHIFEPFFTTKEVGKGTGLGLSIAHSILADHNGRIFHERSALGGAAFVFELPIVTGTSTGEPGDSLSLRSAAVTGTSRKSAEILVLDDEQAIAELLGEMLGMLGYSTSTCNSAQEALDLIGRKKFDVVISDFRMPRMNGQDFYEAVAARKPDLADRIIFLTGDAVNEDTQAFLHSTGNPHLMKPFKLARVEQTVVELLRKTSRGVGV